MKISVRHVMSFTLALAVTTALATVPALPRATFAGAEDWNDAGVQWMPYEDGLAAAKKAHKPICLIFYTTWCPHCANYSKLFSNPDIVQKSKSFVMVRLDKDKNLELSKKYSPDGEYIPRTYFLSADGKLDASLTEERPQYKYFYSESDPGSILAGMDRALKKLQ
jgi:thiol:disulfide interchange protein